MRDTKKRITLWETLQDALCAPAFCKAMNLTPEEVRNRFQEYHLKAACRRLKAAADADGRFAAGTVLPILQDYLPSLANEPQEGWLVDCYNYVLRKIFPETTEPEEADTASRYETGRLVFLQILRGLYHYEKVHLPFDPRYNFEMLPVKEVKNEHFTREYLRLRTLVRDKYIYEFMRLATEVTPFNALGHIGGVTYVATFMARQLHKRGVPVDVALIAGAAAVHDMGKYGVKKGEERRVPYLHYYYTDIFCEREGLPQMGHIAANHSVWDLELENLSVESLLLIYADFRVKSSRNEKRQEVIHFYTLKEAFDVILSKLDDVDDAKRQRYQRVYAKLADFEDYMLELGVTVDLPENFAQVPARERVVHRKENVLMEGEEVVRQLKFTAIAHNIRLMGIFRSESDFGNLIEAARSEQNWKNLRTYITIFEEYSTYMTEQQKLMTLQFLFELLSHREEDIRVQAAELMGRIVARFNERYTKELPKGVNLPRKKVTNQSLFSQFVAQIIDPGRRYTQQHKTWIGSCLGPFVRSVLATRYERIGTAVANIAEDKNPTAPYLEVLQKYYEAASPEQEERMTLLQALLALRPEDLTAGFCRIVRAYLAKAAQQDENTIVRLAALYGMHHLFKKELDETEFIRQLLRTMNLPEGPQQFQGRESSLFLEDLKTGTHWLVKIANIHLMCHALLQQKEQQSGMHLGMHLCNLVKVSEHLAVRQAAGEALLAIADSMTYAQRNEMAVELFNGLEIGDLQIAKYVPEYLGKMALKLRPGELDEFINTLQEEIESTNFQLATSAVNTMGVILENFQDFAARVPEEKEQNEKRQLRLLYAILRACAHYNKELSRDAFRGIGTYVFHSAVMPEERKDFLFLHSYKKIWVLLNENTENMLDFYSNAAVLNHIYRFISWSEFAHGHFVLPLERKVCFYPGTFDPFSSGHKAVAKRIRDMGFVVYLALDEFSWSKHTQPRLMRRKIMNMSVADTENIYPFSENLSVNIANPDDVKKLKDIFADKELYLAVGSDVVENASAYRLPPGPNTIHSVNHIIFERETREQANWYADAAPDKYREKRAEKLIKGDVIHLKLDKFYEDVSSTRIRENIDQNRDISALIDPVAQNFIYANNLYLREPAYKHVLEAQEIGIGDFKPRTWEELPYLQHIAGSMGANPLLLKRYLEWEGYNAHRIYTQYVDTGDRGEHIVAFGAVHQVPMQKLLVEFRDGRVAEHVREEAAGRIAALGYFYVSDDSSISNPGQILLAEMMTELINRDFTYVVYHPVDPSGYNERTIEALTRQGFVDIAPEGSPHPLYAVHIKSPVVLFRDVETTIKNPFNKNPRVLRALDKAHNNLLDVMRRIYPGKLILSFNTSAMHYRIIQKVARLNGVSTMEDPQKRRGPYMSVPFGKALSDVLVPNTVTKALHIEKYFNRAVKGFTLAEAHHYATVDNQVKTIKSFHRPVILIDDLLEKGHRMRMLTPYLKKNDVEVKAVLAGVMSGFAMDLMAQQGYHCECAYFLPSLEMWLNERDCYPFIGGDSIDNANNYSGYDRNPSVNLILPYVKPEFIQHGDEDAAFIYSLTCLQNAKLIMETLQDEYQALFEKRLTLTRLGEVITVPRIPDIDIGVKFDPNMDLTRFIENDIERLVRLRWGELGLSLQHESERNRGGE